MEELKNLEQLTAEISNQLFDSLNILEIFEEIVECDRKEGFLITSLQKNIDKAFKYTEMCRELISIPD